MKKAVMYGAGNVGRGFLGQLFAESGYEVVFVDIVPELLAALNAKGSYRLLLVSNEGEQEIQVRNVRAVDGRDAQCVATELADADLAATAVGASVLPRIAPVVAAAIVQRAQATPSRPLNIIICENLKDAASIFRGMLESHVPDPYKGFLSEQVGLVEAVIGRMVPIVPPELQKKDPSLILAEPYKVLPVDRDGFVGPIPNIVGMEPHDRFVAYVDRKLYIHNAGHAVLAYLGYLKGWTYGYEALADPDIYPWLRRALDESQKALVAHHGLDVAALRAHVDDLLARFGNRALGDTIYRLGRDPLRKLGPTDRLVGAANLALAHGITPLGLATGIAAGLAFDHPDDPRAVELQRRLAAQGLDAVLQEVCGIEPTGALASLVKKRHALVRTGRHWQA